MSIHPTAIIDPSAQIASDVEIGPFSIIDANVKIGSGCIIDSHVRITGYTEIGSDCHIFQGAVIGMPPQDLKFRNEEVSYLKIGSGNIFREFVTIHRATGEGCSTIIGDNNFLMGYVHVGHNCVLGSNIIVSNVSSFAGHVTIEDNVVVGGMTGVHQFVRIGAFAMAGGCSRITKDIPPYSTVAGSPERFYGLNVVGLRRNGISSETRIALKKAFAVFCSKNKLQALAEVETHFEMTPEMRHLIEFIKAPSKRGVCFKTELTKKESDKNTIL